MPISNTPHNNPFPFSGEPETDELRRYLPLPDAASMREGALFGIPLKSSLTGQEVTDKMIEKYITQAISELEHMLGIFITPIKFDERFDYDREIWTQQYAWQKLSHRPILDVQKVQLNFGNGTPLPPLVDFPLEFVHVNPQDGAIRLVPVLGTPSAGFVLSSFAGAQYQALLAMGVHNFPGAVRIMYRAGFEKDKVPGMLVGLIEKMAALQILSVLGHLIFPYSSVSTSIDGTGQSVGTPGIQFLAGRISELKEQIASALEAIKSYYNARILIDYL